jgi:hypothetical protein
MQRARGTASQRKVAALKSPHPAQDAGRATKAKETSACTETRPESERRYYSVLSFAARAADLPQLLPVDCSAACPELT